MEELALHESMCQPALPPEEWEPPSAMQEPAALQQPVASQEEATCSQDAEKLLDSQSPQLPVEEEVDCETEPTAVSESAAVPLALRTSGPPKLRRLRTKTMVPKLLQHPTPQKPMQLPQTHKECFVQVHVV